MDGEHRGSYRCPFFADGCDRVFDVEKNANIHAAKAHGSALKRKRVYGNTAGEDDEMDAPPAPMPPYLGVYGPGADAELDDDVGDEEDGGLGEYAAEDGGVEENADEMPYEDDFVSDDQDGIIDWHNALENDGDIDDAEDAGGDAAQPAAPLPPAHGGPPPIDVGVYSTPLDGWERPMVGTWTELALGGAMFQGCTMAFAEALFAIIKDPRFKREDLKNVARCIRLLKRQMEADCPALRVHSTPVSFGSGVNKSPPLPAWKGSALVHHKLAPLISRALVDASITEWDKLLRFDPAVARVILESPDGPDDPVDEPMYTRANLQLMLDRFNHFKSLGYADEDIFIVGVGLQWDAMRPDQVGNLKLDQVVMVRGDETW